VLVLENDGSAGGRQAAQSTTTGTRRSAARRRGGPSRRAECSRCAALKGQLAQLDRLQALCDSTSAWRVTLTAAAKSPVNVRRGQLKRATRSSRGRTASGRAAAHDQQPRALGNAW